MEEKILFTIPIYNQSEIEFKAKWERKFRKELDDLSVSEDEIIKGIRQLFLSRNPLLHKFNDVCGYVEVVYDGGVNILNYYYFNGDRRKRYNKNIPFRSNIHKIYPPLSHEEGGRIWEFSKQGIRNGISEALAEIQKTTSEINCYIELGNINKLINNLNLKDFIM